MPSTRDIRRRIRSVKNTAQITKAMQMVASAKMRKAQLAALAGRPYAKLMAEIISQATAGAGEFSHPLMEVRPVKRRALVLITTDKGLCGALNTNLLREAAKAEPSTIFICAGRKGAQWAARAKRELAAEVTCKDAPIFADARAVGKIVRDLFLEGKVDRVDVAYSRFVSTLSQVPDSAQLLPIGELKVPGVGKPKSDDAQEFLFEPAAPAVLGNLLPHYLNYFIFQLLLEAKASEHSARMVAMKNATDNAKQIIKELTLEYNKLRQANITKELLEITSAAMAMG
jgi:F-type H+-transporting ATPase subunit gamma